MAEEPNKISGSPDGNKVKMNPAVKAKWVATLRSGEYPQGVDTLRTAENEYCCLGVLSELAVQDGVINPAKMDSVSGVYLYYNKGDDVGNEAYLVLDVQKWAGLTEQDPYIEDIACSLSQLNDKRVSFPGIAEIIEEHL